MIIVVTEVVTLSRIFNQLGFFAEFSLYTGVRIKNIAERINEAARAKAAQRPSFAC
jgi:hypothetical protein